LQILNVNKDTFKYSPNLQKKTTDLEINEKSGNQNLKMQFPSITDSNTEQFSTGLTPFKSCEKTAKCMRYADIGAS